MWTLIKINNLSFVNKNITFPDLFNSHIIQLDDVLLMTGRYNNNVFVCISICMYSLSVKSLIFTLIYNNITDLINHVED